MNSLEALLSENLDNDQLYCYLSSLRNEIFKKLERNHLEIINFIAETKDEIIRKINASNKQVKTSQNRLKTDVFEKFEEIENTLRHNNIKHTNNRFNGDEDDTKYNSETSRLKKLWRKKSDEIDLNEFINREDNDRIKPGVNAEEDFLSEFCRSNFGDVLPVISSKVVENVEDNVPDVHNEMPLDAAGEALPEVAFEDNDMLVILHLLSKELNLNYDEENVRILCKEMSIAIQFRDRIECGRWQEAAKNHMKNLQFIEQNRGYDELLELENLDVIPNVEQFDCPVCFSVCEPGEGVRLRECLHEFCKECLVQRVETTMETEVTCPFGDGNFICPSVILHREIKQIVPKELYDKYLERSLTIVGNQMDNTVHCKTPDCRNFYVLVGGEDENIREFPCDVCKKVNCIPCKAVHMGMNCKEYQTELKILSEKDPKARETLRMFEKEIAEKKAMHCPKCNIIVMKISGCDYMTCSMCKTDICWATLGPRWGPGGRGDNSGGCGCNINGKRCSPICQNCH